MEVKKIYITGCARSGTTLLARMFEAFNDTYVIQEEVSVTDFCNPTHNLPEGTKYVVGKRTEGTIFGNVLSNREFERQLYLLENEQAIVINCIRDGRQVVDGWQKSWGVYDPFTWMQSIMDAEKYEPFINLTVRYDHLIALSDEVQEKIQALTGQDSFTKFSKYPNFCSGYAFKTDDPKYVLRPLNKDILKKTPDTYLKAPNNVQYFNFLLEKLGYK